MSWTGFWFKFNFMMTGREKKFLIFGIGIGILILLLFQMTWFMITDGVRYRHNYQRYTLIWKENLSRVHFYKLGKDTFMPVKPPTKKEMWVIKKKGKKSRKVKIEVYECKKYLKGFSVTSIMKNRRGDFYSLTEARKERKKKDCGKLFQSNEKGMRTGGVCNTKAEEYVCYSYRHRWQNQPLDVVAWPQYQGEIPLDYSL